MRCLNLFVALGIVCAVNAVIDDDKPDWDLVELPEINKYDQNQAKDGSFATPKQRTPRAVPSVPAKAISLEYEKEYLTETEPEEQSTLYPSRGIPSADSASSNNNKMKTTPGEVASTINGEIHTTSFVDKDTYDQDKENPKSLNSDEKDGIIEFPYLSMAEREKGLKMDKQEPVSDANNYWEVNNDGLEISTTEDSLKDTDRENLMNKEDLEITHFAIKLKDLKVPGVTLPSITIVPAKTSAYSILIPDLPICPRRRLISDDIVVADGVTYEERRKMSANFKPEFDWEKVTQVDHKYYTSAFISDEAFFRKHWINITRSTNTMVVHPAVSSKVFRHAYMKKLGFDFPFFGHIVNNVTLLTNGFVHTTPPGQKWLANIQNISPLMADFDTSKSQDSAVQLFEDYDKITIVWENMTLHDKKDDKFTFAVTLYDNGDIAFAYKDIPMNVKELDEKKCPVYIGLADSYYVNKIAFYSKRKAIHSYSRISFNDYNITSHSVLKLFARPSCPIHNNCYDCVNHHLEYDNFQCLWCEKLGKCSCGTDYNKPFMTECNFDHACNLSSSPSAAENEYMDRLVVKFKENVLLGERTPNSRVRRERKPDKKESLHLKKRKPQDDKAGTNLMSVD